MIIVALPIIAAAAAVITGILYVVIGYAKVLRRRRRMPPGPFPIPLFGNLFLMPAAQQWLKFQEWSQTYKSPIITFWDGHTPIVVCCDAWSMSDLCDKRAHIYSSRAIKVLTGRVFGLHKFNQAGLPYGDQWRLHRRLTHSVTNSNVVQAYRDVQGNEAKILVASLLDQPDRFADQALRFAVSLVSIVAWGRRIVDDNDTVLQVAQNFVGSSNLGFPGKTYTEAIPILAEMPEWLNPLPNMLRRLATTSNKYFYALTLEGAGPDRVNDNFARRLLREKETTGLSKVEISNLTGNFIGAGVDTTASTLLTFVLCMCLNPDVQARAHAELDSVVGRGRLPGWADEDRLPYLSAIINETLRWRPTFALGGPAHAPTEDDIYKGYLIPAGTSVIGNLYAISKNPREYPQPDRFWPERFLEGFARPAYPNKRGHNAFGWGRRVCSGEPLAQQSLYLVVSALLWAFDIRPGLDEHGNQVQLDPNAYGVSQVNRPLPFKMRFIPRHEGVGAMVRQEAEEAQAMLRSYEAPTSVTFENAQSVSLDDTIATAEKK